MQLFAQHNFNSQLRLQDSWQSVILWLLLSKWPLVGFLPLTMQRTQPPFLLVGPATMVFSHHLMWQFARLASDGSIQVTTVITFMCNVQCPWTFMCNIQMYLMRTDHIFLLTVRQTQALPPLPSASQNVGNLPPYQFALPLTYHCWLVYSTAGSSQQYLLRRSSNKLSRMCQSLNWAPGSSWLVHKEPKELE